MTGKKTNVEISVKGKWVSVPALELGGKNIVVQGKWLRIAVVESEEWLETELDDPETCVLMLKEERSPELRADILSFAQKIPASNPKYDYPLEWDSIAAIRIHSFKEWWDSLPQETRKNVRRAEKRGVVVQVRELDETLTRCILDLNNDSPVRQGKAFTHFGKTLDQVAKDQVAYLDRSDYVCAYGGGELIGVMKIVYRGDVAAILTFLPKASHNDKRPANALIAKAVELCASKGKGHLTFGRFNYGNKQQTPLREFKIRNGFGEILMPRYFVPLTAKGKLGVSLKLHRGLLGILPHCVITTLVNARSRFYGFTPSRCSSMPERPNSNRQMECSNPPAGSIF